MQCALKTQQYVWHLTLKRLTCCGSIFSEPHVQRKRTKLETEKGWEKRTKSNRKKNQRLTANRAGWPDWDEGQRGMHPVFLHTMVGWGQFSVASLDFLQTKSPKKQLRSLEVLSCCQIRQFCWHKFGEGIPRRPSRGAGLQAARVKPIQGHIPEQITCRLWRGWGACSTALPGACTMRCLPTQCLPYLA